MKYQIDESKCLGCGMCLEYCKNEAIQIVTGSGYGGCRIDQLICKKCGACLFTDCPGGAIQLIK
jgi:heterodisulfide reductase subunit A-like polyferredoxin